ncbi:DNA-directed RNA polymerase subunit alpha [Candidatus Uhrbacteria bacterium]|nr:DNA-directed RNA polymerase subunit alpha [Candidatus Uhrbacteria bacterium]
MEQLLLPTRVELIPEKDQKKATLIVEPCHPGYGTTVGNALRRVLLSSLSGGAVTAVKIQGADHEFASIPNVKEDVVQILLNLKQLRPKVHGSESVRLMLTANGAKEVYARDISPNADVEIANPDLYIATLTDKDASLSMEIFVRPGRGYVPIEEREEENREIGVIAIDSVFTPVHSVGYRIEDVRVGHKTNYDRLTMNIETDGTIDPAEAVRQATKILMDHFNLLVNIEPTSGRKSSKKKAEAAEAEAAEPAAAEAVTENAKEGAV